MLAVDKIDEYYLVKYSKIPTNGAGYIISKSGANKFIKKRHIRRALDDDLQRDWQFGIETIGVFPKPVVQKDGMVSSIDSIDKRNRTLLYKLFIDSPFDVLRANIHLTKMIGLCNYFKLQQLNLIIELNIYFSQKKINFIKLFNKIKRYDR